MIIQSLRIRNWRKLESVVLDQLSPTLNVVHAPNRVGKTSMVEAVRCTLVDFEHDTTRIAPIVPWNTALVPEVTVGFRTVGDKYSLMKRFTKRREGGAELRRIVDDEGLGQLVATDKEATARARELLGINRSDRGIAQLLWVEQGAVDLPRIDEELDRVLRPVLGSVVSGRDLDFREILWSRMGQWFTSEENAVQKKHRKNSQLTVLSEAINSHEEEVEGIAAEFRKVQELISEAERKEVEIAEAEAAVASALGEVEALKRTDRELEEKRRKADEFSGAVVACEERLGKLEGALKTCCLNASQIEELKLKLESAGQECKPLQEAVIAAGEDVNLTAKARETADRKVEELRKRGGGVEGMSSLLQIQSELNRTRKALATARELERKIAETETASARLAAPDNKQLGEIKKTIDRLVDLDAELKAAQLALEVKASDGGAIGLEIDGGTSESLGLAPDAIVRRSVRQRVSVAIEGFGALTVVRGREDQGLEELAKEHGDLTQQLANSQAQWNIGDLSRSDVVPELTRRITEKASLETEGKRLKEELVGAAPDGASALSGTIEGLGEQRLGILTLHEDLAEWVPCEAEYREAKADLARLTSNALSTASSAKAAEKGARLRLGNAEKAARESEAKLQEVKTEFAKAEGSRDSHVREYGTKDDIVAAVEAKTGELARNTKEFEQHRLTKDEERVPEDLEAAEGAVETRRERLGALKERLAGLLGQLRNTEGLQARRVAAEQVLQAARKEFERLSTDVEAHVTLLRLFDEVRDENVEKSIGPVSELVSAWLVELDGAAQNSPVFGSNLAMEGLTVAGGQNVAVDDATSYGEREQLATLVRLAYGVVLAQDEPEVVILDDPLAHADIFRHKKMLGVIREASRRNLQVIIMTCHPERFDHLTEATFFDLEKAG